MTDLQMRLCDHCGQVDDHPRHVHAVALGDGQTNPEVASKAIAAAVALGPDVVEQVIAQIQDTSVQAWHLDCCREAGCPSEDSPFPSCREVTAGAEDKRGSALRKHLTAQPPTETVNLQPDGPPVPGDVKFSQMLGQEG
jgi:hypothetical protein